MEHAMSSSEVAAPPRPDDPPSLVSELRSSALLFGLVAAIVSAALLITKAVGA